MKTIVVGYDESEPAQRALTRAAELATAFGSTVIVTSVAPPPLPAHGRGMGSIDPLDPPERHREELRRAEELLAEHGITGEFDLAKGDAADHIAQLAEDRQADLVVVGARGLNLIERMLGMSVSGKVGRKVQCDVLLVH